MKKIPYLILAFMPNSLTIWQVRKIYMDYYTIIAASKLKIKNVVPLNNMKA
jgi:hypothetical protein